MIFTITTEKIIVLFIIELKLKIFANLQMNSNILSMSFVRANLILQSIQKKNIVTPLRSTTTTSYMNAPIALQAQH
jgi:hypothetical protein